MTRPLLFISALLLAGCKTAAPAAEQPAPAHAPADAFAVAESWIESDHGLANWTSAWIERLRCIPDGQCSALVIGEGDATSVVLVLRRTSDHWEITSVQTRPPTR